MASTVSIKQLVSRLESSVSAERIEALQELQTASRTSPDSVGEIALRNVFDLLRSQSSSEEYSEVLDLTSRLIKTRDRDAALKNAQRILSEEGNVELLLDLLEHSDLMVGVMTSEILTELHTNDREGLESQIQHCPDGMNKLLQRLPDSSREEVRNQAIVLIQQLTSRNEEMKKTVVFNEGFDILFRIISEEGGATEASLVTSDCLKICNNLLMGSETCQRLFYAMGTEWILRLADFFNPMILETMDIRYNSLMNQESNQTTCWFDESNRLSCAVLAIAILSNSLQYVNAKHQSVIAENAAQVLQSAMYWIGRNGPVEMLVASLSLLDAVVAKNASIAHSLSAMFVKITPNNKGKNISLDGEVASLQYAWRMLPTDERRCISLLALLAERYAISCRPWKAPFSTIIQGDLGFEGGYVVLLSGDLDSGSVNPYLLLFQRILSVDPMIPDTCVQYVLAPPPPPMGMGDEDDDGYEASPAVLETMRPVCSILLQHLTQYCQKLLSGHMQYSAGLGSNPAAMKIEIEGTERLFHLLTVVFMNASLLGRELSTAITTSHCTSSMDGQDLRLREIDAENKAILPFVLSAVGRAARLPGGFGFPLVKASMVWLATVVCGCERATHMIFEDPTNLFVVDLATASSESAGVPAYVQVSACFFLACCLLALPAESPEQEGATEGVSSSTLKRKSFLTVIDSKIGLNRFTETLKKPLLTVRKPTASLENFFFIPDFRAFYETQVQNVKDVIFEMYSGVGGNATGVEGLHLQMINVQKAKIQELEEKLRDIQGKSGSSGTVSAEELQRLRTVLREKEEEATAFQTASESLSLRLHESTQDFEHEVAKTNSLRTEVNDLQQVLNERERAMQELIESNESLIEQHREEAGRWRMREERNEEEILNLKEGILKEASLRRSLEESVEQKNKKIFLLESELTELQEARPAELAQLSESRNKAASLEEQVRQWQAEKELWQRRCEQLQAELQKRGSQATVSEANDAIDGGDPRAQKLEESVALLQSQLDAKTREWTIVSEENAGMQKRLEIAISPMRAAESSAILMEDDQESGSTQILVNKLREHLTRLSQEIVNTSESIGNLPAGVGDDGEEEHEAADEKEIDPDDRCLVRAIHKLQNLRLAISFVAGECSEIYEDLNLPMEKLVDAEGTLGRCYEVVLELNDVFLQRGDQLCIEVDKLKASLEGYEQKFKELEDDKSSKPASPITNLPTPISESHEKETQRLKEQIVELEGSLEDWQGQAEEAAAEARHWRAYADELQHQWEASCLHPPSAVEDTASTTNKESDRDHVNVSSFLQELQATVERLQEQLQAQGLMSQETLSKERGAWQHVETLLKNEIQNLGEQLSSLQDELDKQRDSHSELGRLRETLAELEGELETERNRAHEDLADKESCIARYQDDMEEKEKLLKNRQVEILGLQDALIQAQQKLQQAEVELGQLTLTKEKQESSLQGELALLREQHAAALAKEVIVANTNDDAKLRFEADMAALHAAKHQLETQLESALTQLDVEKQLVKTLKEKISVLEARTHAMSQDIASCHQEADALNVRILSMEAAKHQEEENAQTVLLAARKEHEAAVCALDAQLTSSKESIASLTIEKDRLTVLLSALEKQHSEMSSTLQRSLQMEVEKVKDLEQSIVVLEESNSEKIALLEQKDAHIMDLAGQLADKDERMAHLMEVHEQERQARRDTLPPVPIFNNTVQLQDVEIRRLNTTVERLTKEIKQYEQENLSFKPLLSKREGEVTLLKDQLEMLQGETSRLQKNNDQLHLKIEDLDRQLRDKTVAFQHAPPHSTIGRFAEYNVLPTSERMQVTEAMHLLHDFMLRTNEKHHLPDYFKTEISRDLTTQDLPDLALALKRSLQEIIGKMDAEIDGFAKMLSAKDKELATLKATLVAIKHSRQNEDLGSSLVNQSVNHSGLMSPIHQSPSDSERKRLLRSVEKTPVKDESSFVTPLKGQSGREPTINSASRLASDWSGSSVNRSGGRRSVTVTPSAKEAARYHAELIRERKKLVVLEEEHADLLGLIAQQEIELSVFREKLQKLLGQDLVTVEREARDNVEKHYGVYTNFRDLADA